MMKISEMKERLNTIEIIENIGDDGLIDIDDIVKIDMIFSEEDREEIIYKLVGATAKFGINDAFQEVSINSPIGNAMYHKKVGDIVNYKVVI